jgi:thioredoxin reductase
MVFDAIIVGAGPAGLNAALVLGRAQRDVLVCDTGQPRNAPVHAMHGFLSRDGTDPHELRRIAREQLAQYPSVELRSIGVDAAHREEDRFELELSDHTVVATRRVLLASGVVDELPPIDGLAEHWGRGIFNCPYCDGWELRDQPLAVLGNDAVNLFLAFNLVRWSRDLVLCTNGTTPDDNSIRVLDDRNIALRSENVIRIEGNGHALQRIVFAEGAPLERKALFTHPPTRQHSDLPRQLGCALLDDRSVEVDDLGHTSVPGVYAAGDMARRTTMPVAGAMVIIAAAEGAVSGVAIDQDLFLESLG